MTYWEETIPADPNPGPLVYAALESKMLAIGWTLVDTVVLGARTHKVLKSAAAGNTRNLDWYLDISYPTTGIATRLMLAPFEGYNATTDLGIRGPHSSSGTTLDATTYSRFGDTGQSLETQWANSAAYTNLGTPLTTAAFAINVSVTRDRIVLLSSTDPTQVSYSGFFKPTTAHAAHAGSALFPLVMTRLAGVSDRISSNVSSTAVLTRVPRLSSINWSAHCAVGANNMRLNGRVGGPASEADNQVTTVPFLVGLGSTNWTTATASQVGELDGVQVAWADPAVARGDTAVVAGVTHTLSTVFNNATVLMAQV